ncbi:MAG: MBL fold metallo-hydrolase, partial [Candidatus Methanofastidiosia archaeon]
MIHEIISFSYSSNTYILTGDPNIMIDPGLPENSALKNFLAKNPMEIETVINTHCHYDHAGGNFGNTMIHKDDADALEKGTEKTVYTSFTDHFEGFPIFCMLEEGDIISNSNHKVEVIHTPGHTS